MIVAWPPFSCLKPSWNRRGGELIEQNADENLAEAGMALANAYARMGNYAYRETYTRLAAKRPGKQ